MNLELFNETKWKILTEITQNPQSALDLSKKFGTTISNIVQQLKILDYAGLISKKKQKSNGPGKAKTMYYLLKNKTYVIELNHNGARQKEIRKSDHQSLTTNIWLYAKEEEKYYLEKFFWEHENIIRDSSLILLKKQNGSSISLEIVSKEKIKRSVKINGNGRSKEITLKSFEDTMIDRNNYIILLDKDNISSRNMGDSIE